MKYVYLSITKQTEEPFQLDLVNLACFTFLNKAPSQIFLFKINDICRFAKMSGNKIRKKTL